MWKNTVETGSLPTIIYYAHAHYMLNNYGYKHTLTICNTYSFSTAKMVSRTHLHITLYVHCLSCLVCLCSPFIAILLSFVLTLRCNAWKVYVETLPFTIYSGVYSPIWGDFLQVFIHQFKTGHNQISPYLLQIIIYIIVLQFDVLNYEANRKKTSDQTVNKFSGCRM